VVVVEVAVVMEETEVLPLARVAFLVVGLRFSQQGLLVQSALFGPVQPVLSHQQTLATFNQE
jgi:hypothetical protein